MLTNKIQIGNKQVEYSYKKNDINKHVIVFLNGMNASANMIELFNHPIFKENYIVTFNIPGHLACETKGTASFWKIRDYCIKVIKALKLEEIFKNKKFIIMGESFGSSLALLISRKEPQLVDLLFCWNAPTKISNNKIPLKETMVIGLKHVITLVCGIETMTYGHFDNNITSNKAIIRINQMKPRIKSSSRLNIAVWKSMFYTYFIIQRKNWNTNFYYIQSAQDVMCRKKILSVVNKNFYKFDKGRHLLSFEPQSNELFALFQLKIDSL